MTDIARFLWPIFKGYAGIATAPYRANLAVTKECHSRCRHCEIWKAGRSPDELTVDEYGKIAANGLSLRWLSLTGGEPTDREDLAEIVEAFHSRNPLYMVNFSTNGLHQSRILRAVERLLALDLPRLIVAVSIDGPAAENDRLRGLAGDFACATRTLRSLFEIKARGLEVFASMTLYRENVHLVDAMIEELSAGAPFRGERVHLNIAHSSYLYGNQACPPEPFDPSPAIRSLARRQKFNFTFQDILERTYRNLAIRYARSKRIPISCAALKASFHLDEIGRLYPCTIWDRPLGQVRDHGYSIPSILSTAESARVRAQAKQRKCPNCWSPCEAYQTIAAHPLQSLAQSVFLK